MRASDRSIGHSRCTRCVDKFVIDPVLQPIPSQLKTLRTTQLCPHTPPIQITLPAAWNLAVQVHIHSYELLRAKDNP